MREEPEAGNVAQRTVIGVTGHPTGGHQGDLARGDFHFRAVQPGSMGGIDLPPFADRGLFRHVSDGGDDYAIINR